MYIPDHKRTVTELKIELPSAYEDWVLVANLSDDYFDHANRQIITDWLVERGMGGEMLFTADEVNGDLSNLLLAPNSNALAYFVKHVETPFKDPECYVLCNDTFLDIMRDEVNNWWEDADLGSRVHLLNQNDVPLQFAVETIAPAEVSYALAHAWQE